jgi:very-short-patch-repair endonuclease
VALQQSQVRKLGIQALIEVEDLLQAAIDSFPPGRYLKVHYRSEHPALIDFSNNAFYDGQLEAPPSRGGFASKRRPILYHDVKGTYVERTNEAEASRVVALLKSFWMAEGSAPTIGVVTFNQPQQELIQDLIQRECEKDPAFQARYQQEQNRHESNQDVGFFVKNLENVQGDERDVMIFSTTFGRNGQDRFYRRFGPVGSIGGERRLNVAVTRAKSQIFIIGSMPIPEVATALASDNGMATGLRPADYLQLYLAYAQAISGNKEEAATQILAKLRRAAKPVQADGEIESPLEAEVREEVEKLGYRVVSQVGDSGFRIDLAVLHPEPGQGYILGVECDGAAYHSGRSARTRDVWRQQILEDRGWVIHRVWSTSWWNQKPAEIDKLQRALDKALSSPRS